MPKTLWTVSAALLLTFAVATPVSAEFNPPPDSPLTTADKKEVIAYFDEILFDGISARWDWPTMKRRGAFICGKVNAKNRFGAYTGWTPFYYYDKSGKVIAPGESTVLYEAFCNSKISD